MFLIINNYKSNYEIVPTVHQCNSINLFKVRIQLPDWIVREAETQEFNTKSYVQSIHHIIFGWNIKTFEIQTFKFELEQCFPSSAQHTQMM